MTLVLSAVLMILMAAVEYANFRRHGRFTFLSAVHGLIVIGYCLPPFMLHVLPGTPFENGLWGYRLYILDLAERLALPDSAFVTAWLLLFGGYAALVTGYGLGLRVPVTPLGVHPVSSRILIAGVIVMGAVASAALAVYATQFKDAHYFFSSGMNIRGGRIQVNWGYLQVLAQLAFPTFLMAVAAALALRGRARMVLIAVAAVLWAVAAARTFHTAGRFETGSFVVIPLLAWVFMLRSKKVVIPAIAALAVAILFVAIAPHNLFRLGYTYSVLSSMIESLGTDLIKAVLFVLGEYAYPHLVAAHTLTAVPDPIDFRYFIDIPLGFLHMLPSLSGVDTWPPMILSLHVRILPWIPVDLVSFGYYSLGTLGVVITFAGFGVILALFDSWLTHGRGWLAQSFRAAWLFYLPFRLFYADPYVSAQVGFGLITATLFVLAAAWWSKYKELAA
ncbi:MAG: hypothetical protein CMM77_08420 [Rhodospirillaceae bacterium]|nr:hypothetical protein [Rhodospirillaceae bacterium]